MDDATADAPLDLAAHMPLASLLGIGPATHDGGALMAAMPWRAELCTTGGLLHGGALMAFADSLGAAAAFTRLPTGATTSTVSSATSFVRPVRDGMASARAIVEHAGRRFVTVRTEIRDGDGRLVSTTTQTQAVL